MEGVNSFEKGLHRSNSPQEQPEGSYVDALNWIRNDSGRLINEELEEFVQDKPNHTFLGYTPLNDEFICFFQVLGIYSEIGVFTIKNDIPSYKYVFSDSAHSYKLNFKKPIDCVAKLSNTGERVVYFVEENQPARRFNLDIYSPFNTTYDTIEDFSLLLTYKVPYCNLTIKESTGNLESGVYSVVLRYRDEINNKTTFNIPTNFISITDDIPPSNKGQTFSDSIDGCPPQTSTSKSLDITLKHVDSNYKFIEVVIITYIGTGNDLTIKSLGVYDNVENKVINFSSLSQLEDAVPTEEITQIPTFYNSAKSIEQKDNILILSNLTSKSYDLQFQAVADNIDLYWSIGKYGLYCPRVINSVGRTETTRSDVWDYRVKYTGYGVNSIANTTEELPRGLLGVNTVDATDYWQTNIYQDPTVKKGFTRGEVYSFSITPIFKDGSLGFAYHIPGKAKNPLLQFSHQYKVDFWESREEYPSYMNKPSGTKIRHHKMPDFDETGKLGEHTFDSSNVYSGSTINILKVEARNIDFGNLTPLIQGYIIGYQQRNSDVNTRIIDYGFMRSYIKAKQSDKYRNSLFTGNTYYASSYKPSSNTVDSDVWSTQDALQAKTPYAQYYSIDTLYLDKKISASYSIQEIGKGYCLIPNLFGNAVKPSILPLLITKSDSTLARAYLYLFFEEGSQTYAIKTPKKINNAQFVPSLVDAEAPVTIGPITIKQGSRFWHIEVDASANGAFTDPVYTNPKDVLSHTYRIEQSEGSTNNDVMKIQEFWDKKPHIILTRIVNTNPAQYGQLENAEYIPSVVIFDDTNLNYPGNSALPLEGDTYVCKTFMRKWDLLHSAGTKAYDPANTDFEWFDAHMIIGMYVETKNNLALRYKEINGAAYYPKERKIWGVNSNNAGIMNQPEASDSFPYNKQYSALNNIKVTIAMPSFFKDVTNYPNRSIYSNKSFESEVIDQYRIFPAINFHDIPKDRGPITDTFVFNNTFFHHTEYGLWQSFVNPNTTQATSQGEITLGNAGVFKIPSKLILDIKGGYMGTLDKSGTNTPFGRVFLDHHQGKIFLFTGEAPVEISDLGLFSFFREFVNTNDRYAMGYDWANKRLLISSEAQKNTAELVYLNTGGNGTRHSTIATAFNIGFLTSDKYYKTLNASGSNLVPIYYKFELSNKNKLIFLLESLNVNYNIQILNSTGSVIKASNNSDLFSDKIILTLDAGIYYILVRSAVTTTTLGNLNLYITFNNKYAISFYPKTQTWTSLHEFVPTAYLTLNGSSYAWQDSDVSFYNLEHSRGIRKEAHITFVENTQPDAFKRFDRIEMNTMSGGVGGIFEPGSVLDTTNYEFKNQSFTHIHTWTDRQNSTELAFAYSNDYNTNFLNSYDPSKVPVNYYRSSFHAELPLDAVIDPNYNIFGDSTRPNNNLDINADFRAHMKGKFLYTKLTYKDKFDGFGNFIKANKPLVLNYIKTFFKPSVA